MSQNFLSMPARTMISPAPVGSIVPEGSLLQHWLLRQIFSTLRVLPITLIIIVQLFFLRNTKIYVLCTFLIVASTYTVAQRLQIGYVV